MAATIRVTEDARENAEQQAALYHATQDAYEWANDAQSPGCPETMIDRLDVVFALAWEALRRRARALPHRFDCPLCHGGPMDFRLGGGYTGNCPACGLDNEAKS